MGRQKAEGRRKKEERRKKKTLGTGWRSMSELVHEMEYFLAITNQKKKKKKKEVEPK